MIDESQASGPVSALRAHLDKHGGLEGSEGLSLLQDAWQYFEGSDQHAMEAWKLNRFEAASWSAPILVFRVERHGGTVLGSTRAEMQRWSLNLDELTADAKEDGYRQLKPMRGRFNAPAHATEIVEIVVARLDDPRLKWSTDRAQVQVVAHNAANPEGGWIANETLNGRRKALGKALRELLPQHEWEEYAPFRWQKATTE